MSAALVGAIAAAVAAVAVVLALWTRDAPMALPLAHPDAGALRDAGWSRDLRAWEGLRAAVVIAAIAASVVTGAPAAVALLAAAGPSLWIRARAETARGRSRRSFSRMLSSIESALRSGLSLPEAMRRAVAAAGDPIATRPLEEAVRAFDLGASLDTALTSAARGCTDERGAIAIGSLALGIGERLPRERMADLVAAVADRAAFEDGLDDEVRARAAGLRQQQRLLAVTVPVLALYLSLTVPMLSATLATDLGRFVLIPAAICLEVAGIVLSGRVVRAVIR